MGAEDDQFLRAMSEKAAGFYPGLPEVIDELNFEEYGRAIQQDQIEKRLLDISFH